MEKVLKINKLKQRGVRFLLACAVIMILGLGLYAGLMFNPKKNDLKSDPLESRSQTDQSVAVEDQGANVEKEVTICSKDELLEYLNNYSRENRQIEDLYVSTKNTYISGANHLSAHEEYVIVILREECEDEYSSLILYLLRKSTEFEFVEEYPGLTVEPGMSDDPASNYHFLFDDLNGDGSYDIALRRWWGATGNVGYYLWLNKLDTDGKLIYVPEFDFIPQPQFDPNTGLLHSHFRNGCLGAEYVHIRYQWENNLLVPVYKIEHHCPNQNESEEAVFGYEEYQFINESWNLVNIGESNESINPNSLNTPTPEK